MPLHQPAWNPIESLAHLASGRYSRPPAWPDLPPVNLLPKELRRDAEKYTALLTEYYELKKERERLEQGAEAAKRADVEAYAAAIAAGKKDPGPKNEEERVRNLADTTRRQEAIATLLDTTIKTIRKTGAANSSRWAADHADKLAELIEKMNQTLDEYAELRAQVEDLVRMAHWLADPATDRWATIAARTILDPTGNAYIAELRAEIGPPPKAAPPAKLQRPRPTVDQINEGVAPLIGTDAQPETATTGGSYTGPPSILQGEPA